MDASSSVEASVESWLYDLHELDLELFFEYFVARLNNDGDLLTVDEPEEVDEVDNIWPRSVSVATGICCLCIICGGCGVTKCVVLGAMLTIEQL